MKELKCCKCFDKVGEIIKGGLKKSAVIYCDKCWAELMAKATLNPSDNIADNFFNNMFGGVK